VKRATWPIHPQLRNSLHHERARTHAAYMTLLNIDSPTVPKDMKFRITRLIFPGLLAGLFSSCVQDHNLNLSQTTGLVDSLLTASGARKDAVPVEIQSSSPYPTGYISAARAVFASPGIHVYGNVRNSFGVSDSRGHVDIILCLGNGQLVRAIPVDYFPRPIPSTLRGFVGRSQFSANFAEVPSGLASVIVRYHEGEKSNCSYARLKDPHA
jgi:hypothetical protein